MSFKSIRLMLENVAYWIDIPLEESDTSFETMEGQSSENDADYQEDNIIVVWETAVQPLTDLQRLIFFSITIVVVIVALVGNVLVLYVNVSRLYSKARSKQAFMNLLNLFFLFFQETAISLPSLFDFPCRQ